MGGAGSKLDPPIVGNPGMILGAMLLDDPSPQLAADGAHQGEVRPIARMGATPNGAGSMVNLLGADILASEEVAGYAEVFACHRRPSGPQASCWEVRFTAQVE